MSSSWSLVNGSMILRISSGVSGVEGVVPVGIELPISSALRFLIKSMVSMTAEKEEDLWLAWNKP